MYRNHIVKTKQPVFAASQLNNMLSRLDIRMIRFWGFHGNEVPKPAEVENNADIRSPSSLVILDSGISTVEETNVLVTDSIDTQALHGTSSLSV